MDADSPSLPDQIPAHQRRWYLRYGSQPNPPDPADTLLNEDPQPSLDTDMVPLFNGKDLSGWTPLGGTCKFHVDDGEIVGTCVPGSQSTYLSTDRTDFADFLFSCQIKWDVEANTGIMFRARSRPKDDRVEVYGPQAEMEEFSKRRGWSGGIHGQSCGGYFYPLWLKAHENVRHAIDKDGWNRITILAQGDVVKTWVNAVPAAHWVGDGTFRQGFFGLQVHKGKQGVVRFRDIRVREL